MMLFVPFAAAAQETPRDPASLNRNETLSRINRMSQPSEDHKYLKPLVGSWRGKGMARTHPHLKLEPVVCRLQIKWILDGRFLEQRIRCILDGEKLDGVGYLGYDRIAKRYAGAWFNSADSGYTALTGQRKDAVTFIFTLEHNDAVVKKRIRSTNTVTIVGPQKHTQVLTVRDPATGKDVVLSRITYTR